MSLTPGARFGSYEVVAQLGAGAMGEVWRARDTRLSRDVALKVLPASLAMDRERLQRFEREAQVLASLNHPNIAAIYGDEETAGQTALVLELVEGPTLEARIAQGALPPDEAAAIARQIAEALEYAHERGVVHRDLKPANVKLAPDGRVKVLDFGLAKAMAQDGGDRSASAVSPTITSLGTVAGVILGTAAYMAPEQARGSNVDRRADIWSFGVVLWEMLTGKRLFDDATVSDTLAAVLRAPFDWSALPAGVPQGLTRLLKRCLERDPKKRLRDIGEARIALETLDAEPETPAAATGAPVKRRSLAATIVWAITVAVVALFATAITGLVLRQPEERRVVRFEIAQSKEMTETRWPRLSPDGTMIAFQARGKAGKRTIWVRRIDAFEAQELPGTDASGRHWWSPDSRFIAFFTGSQLKKISPAGGPAQLVVDGTSGADGAWGAGGTILFDGRAIDPIQRVEASGGKVAQATKPDAAAGEVGHSWPYFLPDGKHFVFLAMPATPDKKSTIMLAALGEEGSKALAATSSRVEYANGHLVYVLDGTLVAQRFDTESLALSGDPVPLAENVAVDANAASSFSTSANGELVYLSGAGGEESELVWIDRAGRELGKIGPPGSFREIALSPDGSRLAYGAGDSRAQLDVIWVRDLRRDVATRLTFGGSAFWPIWSPDGGRVVYGAFEGSTSNIYDKDAAGAGTERKLFGDPSTLIAPSSWSRDGKWIALVWVPPSRRFQIKLLPMPVDGRTDVKLADYAVDDVAQSSAVFSPDGRYVAYTSTESGTREVYVQTMPTGGGKWQISSGGADSVLWRADGQELFYKTLTDDFVAVPIARGPRFEPGLPQILFKRVVNKVTTTAIANRWAVTADGQKFVVNASRDSRGLPFSVVLNWPATLPQK